MKWVYIFNFFLLICKALNSFWIGFYLFIYKIIRYCFSVIRPGLKLFMRVCYILFTFFDECIVFFKDFFLGIFNAWRVALDFHYDLSCRFVFLIYYYSFLFFLRMDIYALNWSYIYSGRKLSGRSNINYKRLVARRKWYFINRFFLLKYESERVFFWVEAKVIKWRKPFYSVCSRIFNPVLKLLKFLFTHQYNPIYLTLISLHRLIRLYTLYLYRIIFWLHKERAKSRLLYKYAVVQFIWDSCLSWFYSCRAWLKNIWNLWWLGVLNYLFSAITFLIWLMMTPFSVFFSLFQKFTGSTYRWIIREFWVWYWFRYFVIQKVRWVQSCFFHFWILEELFDNKSLVVFFAFNDLLLELLARKSLLSGRLFVALLHSGYAWILRQFKTRYRALTVLILTARGCTDRLYLSLRVQPRLIVMLEMCEVIRDLSWFLGTTVGYGVSLIALILLHAFFMVGQILCGSLLNYIKWLLGPKQVAWIWATWLTTVEYHEDVVEEAFIKYPPADHPRVFRIYLPHKYDRRRKRWVPSVPKGMSYKPQGRGLWSTNKTVRIMRLSKHIYYRFLVFHRINTHFRWMRFFYVVIFINEVPYYLQRKWFAWEDRTERRILTAKLYRRWHIIQPVINVLCNLEEIFLSYTFNAVFNKSFELKVDSIKTIVSIWFTKWVNLFSNGYRLIFNLTPLLKKFEMIINHLETLLPFLRENTQQNAVRLGFLRRSWRTHEGLFTEQVGKVVTLYFRSYPQRPHQRDVKSWVTYVNNSMSVDIDWVVAADSNSIKADADLLHWLASIDGYRDSDAALIDAASGVFRLQDTLLLDLDAIIKSTDRAVKDAEFLVQIECDLMTVEDSLLRLKRSLELINDAALGVSSLAIISLREKRRLITARDRLLHLSRAVWLHMSTLRREAESLLRIHAQLKTDVSVTALPKLKVVITTVDEASVRLNEITSVMLSSTVVPTLWDYQQWEQNVDDLLEFKEGLTSFKSHLRSVVNVLFTATNELIQLSSSPYVTELIRLTGRWQEVRPNFMLQVSTLLAKTNYLLEAPDRCSQTQGHLLVVIHQLGTSVNTCLEITEKLSATAESSLAGEQTLGLIRGEVSTLKNIATEIKDILPLIMSFCLFTIGLPILYCFWVLPFWFCCTFFVLSGPIWYCLLHFAYLVYKYW